MKYNHSTLLFVATLLLTAFVACKKESNTYFSNGKTPVLKCSVTAIAPAPSDSLTKVVTFSWTNPSYATDSSSVKYILEIDSSGRNFSKAVSFVVTGSLTDTFIAKQINTVVLGFGFSFGVKYAVDVRLISSYANNNEQRMSNTITLQVTPYKIPPRVVPPASGTLFLVGDATQGGWNNPVPVPTQQLEQIDSVDYGGVFKLIGGMHYLILPVNGDWGHKFAVANSTVPSGGGDFGYDLSTNFNGPDSSGWYAIMVNFQSGKYTLTPYSSFVPDSLYMVGDATPGGWSNPVPVPSQKLTRLNASQFQLNITLIGGKNYLYLPVNGDWGHKYAVASGTAPVSGGTFGYDLSSNFNGPANGGTYTVLADFLLNKYTVK
jgi:hypothetical protein